MPAKIIWFTGLSGSGKTTLSREINKKLIKKKFKTKIIDGDLFRKKNKNSNNFSKKNIYHNNISIINFISKIFHKYDFIIVAVISPILKSRIKAKNTFGKEYFEIYVKCSIKELMRRDNKGLYVKAKKKKIKNLIGYNSNIRYEKSEYKKIAVNTEKYNLRESLKKILINIL